MPSNAITEINPQSLGPMQQIRPPQNAISVPNPLNVNPFFQASQLLQNNRSLDQQDLALKLKEKQQEFNNSQLLFQQTEAILGYHDKLFEQAYKTQTGQSSGVSPLGLDTKYERGRKLQEQFDAKQADFQKSMDSKFQSSIQGNDVNKMTELYHEMGSGVGRIKQDMLSNPEWRELSGQSKQYEVFMNTLGKLKENSTTLSIDEGKRREVQAAYERLQNGDYADGVHSELQDKAVLNNALGSINNMTFDSKAALGSLDKAAAEVYKQIATGALQTLPNGTVVSQEFSESRSRQMGKELLKSLASGDDNIIKTFEALTGAKRGVTKEQNDAYEKQFTDWVDGVTASHASLYEGQKILTKAAEKVVVNGSEQLKAEAEARAKAGAGTSTSRFGSKTQEERDLQKVEGQLRSEGLNPNDATPDQITQLYNIRKKNGAMALHKEVNPETGKTEIWEVEVDPKTKVRTSENPKKIRLVASFGSVPISDSPNPNDDLGSRNNNPGNIRATPEQIRKHQVEVDDKGFVVFKTIEEGRAAAMADNEAKIDGNSSAMKTSPYMVAKYGDKDLNNYKDFATVEDLLNVRTPAASHGGDNSNSTVEAFLNHLETRGFPRNMLLKDLDKQDKETLNKAIIEFESPDSYARLYNPKPAAAPEQPAQPGADQAGFTGSSFSQTVNTNIPVSKRIVEDQPVTDEEWIAKGKELGIGFHQGSIRGAVLFDSAPGATPLSVNKFALKQQSNKIDDKNRERELKGQPLLKKEDDETYMKLKKLVDSQESYYSEHLPEIKNQIKSAVIAKEHPEIAEKSYADASHILDGIIKNTSDPVDLTEVTQGQVQIPGTITESPNFAGEYIYENNGKKERITGGFDGLKEWIRGHAPALAFKLSEPANLLKEVEVIGEKPNVIKPIDPVDKWGKK